MQKAFIFLILLWGTNNLLAQSDEIVPIILDGKPAFMNKTTGKIVKKAKVKQYQPIRLKGFSSTKKKVSTTVHSTAEHLVIAGENLFAISKFYGLTVNELKRINKLHSNETYIGQILHILKDQKPVKELESSEVDLHVVKSGDTLYSISRKYGITISELKDLNGLTNNNINVNQELIVQ